jgi:FMN-dependent oxidoreductase (nitrilotriacetate monooxygenase family)
MSSSPIKFGIMLHGAGGHMSSWKHPSGPADASVNLEFYIDIAERAEAAGFTFAFVADGLYINEKTIPHFLNRFEPLTILSALATRTSRIGLVGTVSTSYSDPFTIAWQFASLDLISKGRAGWNVVTTPLEGSALNYNRTHPDHTLRYEIADEYLEITQGLWDSWDDDAIIRNRETGQFFDKSKLHTLNHKGRFFQVAGPLNIGRSAQGQPVIFQAGASDSGIKFAGKYAEAVFTNSPTIDDALQYARNIRTSAIAQGRVSSDIKIYPGIGPIVGATREEAEAKFERIRDLLTLDEAISHLGRFFDHHDFSQYDPDAPFPELGDIGQNAFRSNTDRIKADAKAKNLTLRQVALAAATPRPTFIGSASDVADELIRWIDAGAADGFILGFPVIAEGLSDFEHFVIPELIRRGRYDRLHGGVTLRDHLDLSRKESQYAAQRDGVPAKLATSG